MKSIISIFLTLIILQVSGKTVINRERIEIIRDQWGVPHIYAPTDEEVAYGLAWATAEDDFKSIQENYLAVRGELASIKGKDGAIMDFLAAFVGASEVAKAQTDTAFSPKFRRVLDFYCQGINDFAEAHPELIMKKNIFPVKVEDMVAGYVLGLTLMTNVHFGIIRILEGGLPSKDLLAPKGSNAFAVNHCKTKDGKAYLAVNSHQPLEGPFSWYEAHLHSDEGWNILGGTFPGGATIFHGVNENLGWAHTVSFADMDDIYQLRMHPKEKLRYYYNGKWVRLKEKEVRLKVKVGFLTIPVKKTFYESVYGPTLKAPDGHYYSIRFPANMDIRAAEQWYRMNKARNYDEFYEALKIQGIKGLNIIYADKENNIMYLDNAALPERDPSYDWWGVLPGDTSATLWQSNSFARIDDLLKIKNPDCGFVFNTNNTPFLSTGKDCNQRNADIPTSKYYFRFNNNRSLRLEELLNQYDQLSFEDFKTIKYDQKYRAPMYTYSMANIEDVFHLDPEKHRDIADIITELQQWDRNASENSTGATIAALFSHILIYDYVKKNGVPLEEVYLKETDIVPTLRKVKKHLMKHFKTIKVPLGDFQKLVRGNRELPVSGIMDVIATMSVTPYKNGRYKADSGESYIMLVQFDENGPEIETISPYGASNVPGNKHYDDQMEMFTRKQLKPMTLDKSTIEQQAERRYHPGQL